MERLTIEELIEHCDRQMNRIHSGSKIYQEHESVRAYLQILHHYIATGLTPERVAELAQAEKDGRLVVLLEGTVSMLMAKFVDEGDSDMFIPSVEARGSENHLIPLLSLAAIAVAQAHQMDYKVLLEALIANPLVGTLKPAEAEVALREREGNKNERGREEDFLPGGRSG